MNFIRFSIENPVKVAVGVILMVLFGGIAYLSTPVQLTPDVVEPEITISTLGPVRVLMKWNARSSKRRKSS